MVFTVVPSMEGRAIARPNKSTLTRRNLSQQPSMEGRAIARPNDLGASLKALEGLRLQWRAGQLPGQTSHRAGCCACGTALQWRAGQLPGQTITSVFSSAWDGIPSMEGRAIARPNQFGADLHPVGAEPSMEGRAIARPNPEGVDCQRRSRPPSMEGRAIARPNNRITPATTREPAPSMEGRAIARPNQFGADLHPVGAEPSMEGRAIARPNLGKAHRRRGVAVAFNGGPGNCPAKRPISTPGRNWRPSFNGGPGNCPAKPHPAGSAAPPPLSFNGGPGNCPAKRVAGYAVRWYDTNLQWRAGQLPGQTSA